MKPKSNLDYFRWAIISIGFVVIVGQAYVIWWASPDVSRLFSRRTCSLITVVYSTLCTLYAIKSKARAKIPESASGSVAASGITLRDSEQA